MLNNKGFTLVEIIVAIFVISVGIVSIVSMFPLGMKLVNSSQTSAISNQLCQQKIEEILATPYNDIVVGNSSENPLPLPFASFRREVKITYVDPALSMQETTTDKGMKKAEVSVYWNNTLGVGEKSTKITSLISRK